MRMAEVEFRDAQEFIRYQNMHGGVMTFYEIHQAYSPPEHPITSWRAAQQMEEEHVDKLEEIHAEAIKQNASEVIIILQFIFLIKLFLKFLSVVWVLCE